LREVQFAQWERLADGWTMSPGNVPVVRLNIRAQSFCHNMVRCLVSTIVAVGQGRLAENTVQERLESLKRDHLPHRRRRRGFASWGRLPRICPRTPDFVG